MLTSPEYDIQTNNNINAHVCICHVLYYNLNINLYKNYDKRIDNCKSLYLMI
jgi:hypothetical protein